MWSRRVLSFFAVDGPSAVFRAAVAGCVFAGRAEVVVVGDFVAGVDVFERDEPDVSVFDDAFGIGIAGVVCVFCAAAADARVDVVEFVEFEDDHGLAGGFLCVASAAAFFFGDALAGVLEDVFAGVDGGAREESFVVDARCFDADLAVHRGR